MEIATSWVKPPTQIGGLDHLAVQAPCISIYGRLLPGITNVTDRARYYSFYPWLIWSFDRRGFTKYGDAASGVKYTRQIGQVTAEYMDTGLDGDLFHSVVESNTVTTQQLDALSTACPYQLHNNAGESGLLVELFFSRGLFHDLEALPRRRTLQSILQLSTLLADDNAEISEATFRSCAYSGGLPNGQSWPIPESLAQNRAKWSIYARAAFEVLATAQRDQAEDGCDNYSLKSDGAQAVSGVMGPLACW